VGRLSALQAYDVTCSYNQANWPACGDFSITAVTSANEIANIVGQPSTYVDNITQIMILDASKPISFVPTDLFNKLTGITQFTARQASLATITTNAFVNCKHLQYMYFSENPFTTLPASFAEQCFLVKQLDMQWNDLTTIDEKAFKGMYGLEHINFQYNKITCLPPLLFQDNKGLMGVDFSSNYLTALHPLLFQDMTQLYMVSIQNNSISYIPDFDLDHTGTSNQNGFYLMLYDNPIMAIAPLFITHMFYNNTNNNNGNHQISFYPNHQTVTTCVPADWSSNQNWQGADPFNIYGYSWYQQNISYTYSTPCYSNWSPQMADNSLVTCGTIFTTSTSTTTSTTTQSPGGGGSNGTDVIPSDSCTSYRICRYYLDYLNRYTCVIDGADGSVTGIGGIHSSPFTDANVERVYFVNSQLSRIPNVLFQKFPNLNFLYVRSCGMGVINDRTFNECGNLKFLDASFNDIIHIDETSLRNCTHLETIDLTGNPLDYVSTQLYVYDPSLKTVHFNRNPDFTLA
jgi:Leucine-rich repeat (LRR) protein